MKNLRFYKFKFYLCSETQIPLSSVNIPIRTSAQQQVMSAINRNMNAKNPDLQRGLTSAWNALLGSCFKPAFDNFWSYANSNE